MRAEEERYSSLQALCADRRSVLTSRGPDALPAPTLLEGLGEAWGVESEDDASRQLLSFAAVATLGTAERAQAMMMGSTTERLTLALCSLREEQRKLAAMLSLKGLG